MNRWLSSFALLAVWTVAGTVLAQSQPAVQPSAQPAVQPDQPVQPQLPTLQTKSAEGPAPAQPAAPKEPFTLTPQEQAQVDAVLTQWENHNKSINTFDCRFKRWVYDAVFGQPNQAKAIELGVIRYASPDRGLFQVDQEDINGQLSDIPPERAERWIADGKSIFEFKAAQKQLIEHQLPPQLQGKAIADSPLPFLFGSEAQKLKQRYWIRRINPPQGLERQIWLEAWPKYQQEASNFMFAQFAIETKNNEMIPFGLKLYQPNGKDSVAYTFYEVVVNDKIRFFKGNPFRAVTPMGWQKIVEQPAPAAPQDQPQAQARQPSNDQR